MEGHKGHKEGKQADSGSFMQPLVHAARAVSKSNGNWLLLHESCVRGVVTVAAIVTATALGA